MKAVAVGIVGELVSVPLRGLKEMKDNRVNNEVNHERVSVPLRGLKEMKVYYDIEKRSPLCVSVPLRGLKEMKVLPCGMETTMH